MEKPFTIYLDIDGVLVSYLKLMDRDPDGKHSFIPKSVEVLKFITIFRSVPIRTTPSRNNTYMSIKHRDDSIKDLNRFRDERMFTIRIPIH